MIGCNGCQVHNNFAYAALCTCRVVVCGPYTRTRVVKFRDTDTVANQIFENYSI